MGTPTLYYKPRESSGELLVQAVSDTVAAAAGMSALRVTPRLSACSGYSWVQEIKSEPCSNKDAVNAYYERVGHLLLVAYLVGLTDLHHENILPGAGTPCVVDAETMFSTPLRQPVSITQAMRDVNGSIMSSVSGSGMLPVGTGNEMYGGDVSGLSQGRWQRESRALVNLGRDDVKFTKQVLEHTDTSHLPHVVEDGESTALQPMNHVDAIVRGFTRSYRAAVEARRDIALLVADRAPNVQCRLLARRTAEYSMFMSYLWSVTRIGRQEEIYEYLRRRSEGLSEQVVSSEIAQMNEGSIPIFWCSGDSTDVYDPSGALVASLEAPPTHGVYSVLDALGDDDLALQQRLIRFAFDSETTLSLQSPRRMRYERGLQTPAHSAYEGAKDLYRTICKSAVSSESDGSVNWLSLAVDDHDALELRPLAGSLYSGTPGLAVGLLSYRELTGDRSMDPVLRSIGREALESYRRGLAAKQALFSYYNGTLGYLPVLRALGAQGLTDADADQLTHDFVDTCASVPLDDLDADVIGGAAGTIMALATLPDRQQPSRSSLDWPTTWPAYVTAAGPFPDPGPSTMPALPMVPVGSPPRCFMPPWSPVVTSTATPGGRPGSTTSASGAGTPGWTCAETTGFPVPTGATDSPASCWPGAGGLTLTTSTTCSHPTSAQPSVTSCCLLQTGSEVRAWA